MMIEVEGFKKTFFVGLRRRPTVGARGISFSVAAKEIYGFLGPNGAGKTTTIKAMLGLIRPDEGRLRLLGHDASSMGWRAQVGYLPEHPTFYDFLSAHELVAWFGTLSGLARHEAEAQAKRHLERVGLGPAMHRRLRGYSKGMLQRAGLAQALVGNPKLLILDEPMTGLDPIGRKEIRELILELRAEGATVFYSTHILPDVEMTCDRVAIISKGAVRQTGSLKEILGASTSGVSVVVSKLSAELTAKVVERYPGSTEREGRVQVEFEDMDAARGFVTEVLAAGGVLERFEPHRGDLESIFLRALGDDTRAGQDHVS